MSQTSSLGGGVPSRERRNVPVFAVLECPRVRPGPADRLGSFRDGQIAVSVQYADLDEDGILEDGEGAVIRVTLYDDDGSRCRAVRRNIEATLDGLPMDVRSYGDESSWSVLDFLTCGPDPSWEIAGPLLDDNQETSLLAFTDGRTTFTFAIDGLRQLPTMAFADDVDPTAWPSRTPIEVTFGPASARALALDTPLFVRREPEQAPAYSYCTSDQGFCDIPPQVDGNTWRFTTPAWCRTGTYAVLQPGRAFSAVCPEAFPDCAADPEIGVAIGPAAQDLVITEARVDAPCEASLSALAISTYGPGPVSVSRLGVTSPPEGRSVYVEDLDNLVRAGVRLDLPDGIDLPSMGDELQVVGWFEEIEPQNFANRIAVTDPADVVNLGPAQDFDLDGAISLLRWPNDYAVRASNRGVVAELRPDGGFVFETVPGDRVPVDTPWFNLDALDLTPGDRLDILGITRLDDNGDYVLSPRRTTDIAFE